MFVVVGATDCIGKLVGRDGSDRLIGGVLEVFKAVAVMFAVVLIGVEEERGVRCGCSDSSSSSQCGSVAMFSSVGGRVVVLLKG